MGIYLYEGSIPGVDNVAYLHHQWFDGADTLQFDSTDEYFETVEYEPDRPLELRDIL